jgi:hypothetical protein
VQLTAIAIPATMAYIGVRVGEMVSPDKYKAGVIGAVLGIAAAMLGVAIANHVSKALGTPKGVAPAATLGK